MGWFLFLGSGGVFFFSLSYEYDRDDIPRNKIFLPFFFSFRMGRVMARGFILPGVLIKLMQLIN